MSKSKRLEWKRNGIDWNEGKTWKKVDRGICPGCSRQMVKISKTHYLCRRCSWQFQLFIKDINNIYWERTD